jgi:hypothetical protein
MAVKTSTFTGWKLSGQDADAFVKQTNESQPNKRAQQALMRGRAIYKQITETRCFFVAPEKKSLLKKVRDFVKQLATINK